MNRLKVNIGLAAALVAGALALGCTAPDGVRDMTGPSPTPGATATPDLAAGLQVYTHSGSLGTGCNGCHPANGFNLAGKTKAEVTAALAQSPMSDLYAAPNALSDTQLNALVAYLATLQ